MGTGYYNEIIFRLEGDIEEDYEDGMDYNTELIEAELNVIAKKYNLKLSKEKKN